MNEKKFLRKEVVVEGKSYIFETGKVARQANGSVIVQCEGTVVLGAAVASKEPVEGVDFFPLIVDYREKYYAAGKIPGGFYKREGKPGDRETLISRLADRPLRPLFPDGFRNNVIITLQTLSADQVNPPDILAILAASSSLVLSDIPFEGPIGVVRISRLKDEFVINPTYDKIEDIDIDLVVAGTKDAVVMVEGGAKEAKEEDILDAIYYAHQKLQPFIEIQNQMSKELDIKKSEFPIKTVAPELECFIEDMILDDLQKVNKNKDKTLRNEAVLNVFNKVHDYFKQNREDYEDIKIDIQEILNKLERNLVRQETIATGIRVDGRGYDEIREISVEVGVLPRAHGSALFRRGQTQSLGSTTLGTTEDEQRFDNIEGEGSSRFILHYNFPPFSVGEAEPIKAPGRREIGHGALAQRSLEAIIPDEEDFPYTVRVVSEILESNGSSSMASVCSGCLSMMDAGVPIKTPVAGIAMGLIKEDDNIVILTDIQGIEDHCGDMDFKVAGSANGVTGLQMDIKIAGITKEILSNALEKARVARLKILEKMQSIIPAPREELKPYAPRITFVNLPADKIGEVIGPGGKVIRNIQEKSGAKIEIQEDGRALIISTEEEASNKAKEMIEAIIKEIEVGDIYEGTIIRIMPYGAFVNLLPGKDGLLHISEVDYKRIKSIEDYFRIGDKVKVKVIEIDREGKISLSRKALL
ncbi:MAG: polyribonucleotide nucleotidyltransferase [Candidatus Hydrogenedentota bacterium]